MSENQNFRTYEETTYMTRRKMRRIKIIGNGETQYWQATRRENCLIIKYVCRETDKQMLRYKENYKTE